MSSETLTIENVKNFEQQVKLISQIESLNNTSIELVGISNTNAILDKKGLEFNLRTDNNQLEIKSNKDFKKIQFILNNKKFVIFKDSFGSHSKSVKINFSATYGVLGLQTIGFEEMSTYHSFFPVDLKEIRTFHNEFKTVTYQSNGTEYFYDCIRIELDNKQFDIIQFKTDEKGYYVIQSFNNETFKNFNNYCFIIRQAIGFVNGFFVGNEEYVFTKTEEMYYSNYIRPSIKGMYNPIITNPYSRPDIERKIAKQLIGKLTRVSPKTLSNLANKIKDNEELSVVIILLLESTSIRSLLIIPSIFSVIIESLSKIISVPEAGLEYPITDNI